MIQPHKILLLKYIPFEDELAAESKMTVWIFVTGWKAAKMIRNATLKSPTLKILTLSSSILKFVYPNSSIALIELFYWLLCVNI